MESSFKTEFKSKLRARMVGGVFAILPIFLTFAIVRFLLEFVSSFTRPIIEGLSERLVSPEYQHQFASFQILIIFPLSLLLAFLLIYLFGFLAEAGWRQFFDRWLSKLPFIASLYSSIRQVVDVLGSSGEQRGMFERVCLFRMNEDSAEILGFLTATFEDERGVQQGTVYVPMPPNPTSGLLYVAPLTRIRKLNMSADAAMKMIVSGGLLTPKKIETSAVSQLS